MSRRIRKHANPFNVTTTLGFIDRAAIFGREGPIEVDLGCGNGAFIRERARNHPEIDFVGLEVRRPVVEQIAARRADAPQNLAVFYANAHLNLSLAPAGVIRCFHVHFPDPCFKKRHWKRRILQPTIVARMAEILPMGGQVYLQTDIEPLAEEMYEFMAAEPAFDSLLDPSMTTESPFVEKTDWERHHETLGEPVYRMLFAKAREASGRVSTLDFRDTRPATTALRPTP